jgi:hypothetical protein
MLRQEYAMPRPSSSPPFTKQKFNVYLDPELVKEAHEFGLNISKICENALILYMIALKKSGVASPSSEQQVP